MKMEEQNSIIEPMEYDIFIQYMRKFQVNQIGTSQWFESHEILIKFNQQAIIEASSFREELVKELFIINDKIEVLVHEAYCIFVWRTKILPKITIKDYEANATFILYSILYHEATAISLLETLLYHENGCAALGDVSMDLIDYCAQGVIQLIGLTHLKHFEDAPDAGKLTQEKASDEIERQKKDLLFKIGFRCLTILSFIADKMNSLPISVIRRMVVTHDIPCMLSEILHCKPWIRSINKIEKYIDDKWVPVNGIDIVKLTKTEAQVWFCMRNLLFNRDAMGYYEINEFRQRELGKCQLLLSVHVLDQLPPLGELKHLLCTLNVSSSKMKSGNIILEEMPKVKDELIANAKQIGYDIIANEHIDRFLKLETSEMISIAQRINAAYNIEFMEQFDDTQERDKSKSSNSSSKSSDEHRCAQCSTPAIKKCSSCEQSYYCSRECQVKDWSIHKPLCQNKKE